MLRMEAVGALACLRHAFRMLPKEFSSIMEGHGDFACLPYKIRIQIWEWVALFNQDAGQNGETAFALMRMSRRIFDEASEVFYNIMKLQFLVYPEYEYNSWFRVTSSFGPTWNLKGSHDEVVNGFKSIPLGQLNSIQIKIGPPSRTDPGQLICLWKKCLCLSDLLQKGNCGNTRIDIFFPRSCFWMLSEDVDDLASSSGYCSMGEDEYDGRVLQYADSKSEPHSHFYLDSTISIPERDREIVLSAFHLLKDNERINVWMRSQFTYKSPGKFVGIGEIFEDWYRYDDGGVDEYIGRLFLKLDMKLSLLGGKTAAMMRLGRFSSWVGGRSKYESDMASHFHLIQTSAQLKESTYMEHMRLKYHAMRALNPGSFVNRVTAAERYDFLRQLAERHPHCTSIQEAFDLNLVADEWNPDDWYWYFPDGIPPFQSEEFKQLLHIEYCADVFQMYERDREAQEEVWGVAFLDTGRADGYKTFVVPQRKSADLSSMASSAQETGLSEDGERTESEDGERTESGDGERTESEDGERTESEDGERTESEDGEPDW